MDKPYEVKWTDRSLRNAVGIKKYLVRKFGQMEVERFEGLLREFELTVSNFPTLYPESISQKRLRRAVIHKNTKALLQPNFTNQRRMNLQYLLS